MNERWIRAKSALVQTPPSFFFIRILVGLLHGRSAGLFSFPLSDFDLLEEVVERWVGREARSGWFRPLGPGWLEGSGAAPVLAEDSVAGVSADSFACFLRSFLRRFFRRTVSDLGSFLNGVDEN